LLRLAGVEGNLDEVVPVVRRCLAVLENDCNRMRCSMRIDYRMGTAGRLLSEVQKVQALVGKPL